MRNSCTLDFLANEKNLTSFDLHKNGDLIITLKSDPVIGPQLKLWSLSKRERLSSSCVKSSFLPPDRNDFFKNAQVYWHPTDRDYFFLYYPKKGTLIYKICWPEKLGTRKKKMSNKDFATMMIREFALLQINGK